MRSYFLQRVEVIQVIQVIQRDETNKIKRVKKQAVCLLLPLVSFPRRYDLSLLPCFQPPWHLFSAHPHPPFSLCNYWLPLLWRGGLYTTADLIFLSRCLADKKIRAFVNKASILHLLSCIYCRFCDHTCGVIKQKHSGSGAQPCGLHANIIPVAACVWQIKKYMYQWWSVWHAFMSNSSLHICVSTQVFRSPSSHWG